MARDRFDLQAVVRPNIWALKPYRCARDDYSTGILLDANENSFGPALPLTHQSPITLPTDASYSDSHLERYPDPHQAEIKTSLASLRGLSSTSHFFLGVGSDESIDLVIRVFCQPGKDKILICPPTYGMYGVCAQVNDVEVVKVSLDVEGGRFQLQTELVKKALAADPSIKVVFICSPGNPTGTLINHDDIRTILNFEEYKGVVVVDEAYIDFCVTEAGQSPASTAKWVEEYPNLIVCQTLSKSFGLAGIRLGVSISSPQIAQIFNNTKAPYNISSPSSIIARSALSPSGISQMQSHVSRILSERSRLITSLKSLPSIGRILGGNDANFVLAEVLDKEGGKACNERAFGVYKELAEKLGVVVRYRGTELGCEGCLRITVGTEEENGRLLERLRGLLG
ncbi:histidinol-phosphate transaminase [Rhizophlyctis rosea]|uniref:histidinol-phosphate transaminase n=1 Tax=Rhizophlyctis rosea TaxID=64517 RepID=A0AAD5SD84_9FUNG|nr:histidinol-phosphate transaminase [Rhizophlyctis rosea]